jgi:PAS domain S-box-containing protein
MTRGKTGFTLRDFNGPAKSGKKCPGGIIPLFRGVMTGFKSDSKVVSIAVRKCRKICRLFRQIREGSMTSGRKVRDTRSTGRVQGLLLLAVFFLCLVPSPVPALPDQPGHVRDVLVLNSYHPGFVWTASQSDGIIDTLEKSGLNLSISVEYLDWKNYPDKKTLDNVTRVYRDKYGSHPFDVILTTDDAALNYVIGHRSDIFGDAPVVFSGANNYALLNSAQRANITGKTEEISPEKTLSSVFMLFPSTSRIYILYEDTETGRGIADRIRVAESRFQDRAEFIYITNITFDEMATTARTFPAGSVIISAFTRDRNGTVMDHDKVMALLKANAPVPVFSLYDMAMGYGAIGGSILSGRHEGEVAGAMAVRILKGEPVTAVPVNTGDTTLYMFDQDQLDRFSVPEGRLPAGATVINRVPGILDQYFFEVVVAVLAFIILILCIVVLVINIRIRKKAESDLRQNIEKRLLAEKNLRTSEKRYRQLFESSPVSLWEEDFSEGRNYFESLKATGVDNFRHYFGTHPEEVKKCAGLVRIIDVNQATLTLMGAKSKEELVSVLPRIFTEESLVVFREELIRLAEGELQYEGVVRHSTLDGKNISVFLHLTVAPGYEQSLSRILISLLDITERERIEEELRHQYRFLQELMDTIPNPVYFKDAKSRYIGCNRAFEELTGRNREEIIGKTVYEIWPKEMADLYFARDNELFADPGVQVFESSLPGTGGMLNTVIFHKATFHNPDGSVHGLIGVISDITERNMAEVGLQQATRKLNLLNQISLTDIRNAVFSLSGYFELERQHPRDPAHQNYLDKEMKIVRNIADSLQFAKTYQDLGLRPPVWQNVGQVFIFAISHIDLSRLSRQVRVNDLEVYADPLLENVFFTLTENTLLHGGTASRISLFYEGIPDGLLLIYEDDGGGIPADMKERVFDRMIEKKTGLGLYLAREILGITGMTIRETGIPGKGARFEILVPRGRYRFTHPA